jgi:hypothetical protein
VKDLGALEVQQSKTPFLAAAEGENMPVSNRVRKMHTHTLTLGLLALILHHHTSWFAALCDFDKRSATDL